MRNKSVMKHQFSEVPQATIPRSSFNRSHGHKTTFDAGYLVPIYLDEVLPGDTFNLDMTGFCRMATPIKPVMDNLFMETFFFFVPNRLVMDDWKQLMGEEDNPNDGQVYNVPTMTLTVQDQDAFTNKYNNIYNYMGVHTAGLAPCRFITLPFRAYGLIWNEWFRDQNLQDKVTVNKGMSGDAVGDFQLLRRGKRHDYFTSSLPFPQKGDEVTIPTLGTAPVESAGNGVPRFGLGTGTDHVLLSDPATTGPSVDWSPAPTGSQAAAAWRSTALQVDLSEASAVSINDLRVAFQLQKLLERDARGGSRYTEIVHSHFGVTSPDARLQRPEFLGGGTSRINVRQVEQTNQTSAESPQGNLAAYGTASLVNHGFTKSFTEHGFIIGLVNVRADITYQDLFERHWLRYTKYEFYWPALSHIGEQSVYEFELYPTDNTTWPGWSLGTQATTNADIIKNLSAETVGDGAEIQPLPGPGTQAYETPAGVFGYQERYAEYRYKPSRISGIFNSRADQPLDIWHLGQEFSAQPQLSDFFIQDSPPIDRVVAIPSEPDFIADFYFDLRCARPMPLNGTPGNIDRF